MDMIPEPVIGGVSFDDSGPEPPKLAHRQIIMILGAISLGMLPAVIDGTIVATALPSIAGDLGGLDQISWVVTAYLLAMTIATPLFGKFGDLYGRKLLYQIATVAILVSSVLCGLAPTMAVLIGARAIQGFASGGVI